MNAALILQYVLAALEAAPALIEAGGDVQAELASLASDLKAMQATSTDPTAEQWAAQAAKLQAALIALLNARPGVLPLSPVEPMASPAPAADEAPPLVQPTDPLVQ